MTRNEFKKLVEKVNETLSTAKNSVKFTKCLSMLESALEAHKNQIDEYIRDQKYINRLNGMHDTGYMLEDFISAVEFRLDTKDWNWSDWMQYELSCQNIFSPAAPELEYFFSPAPQRCL